jgi:hypothetical protein
VPLPENAESEPPVAVISPAAKSVAASLKVNVMVAVCPLRSEATELVMVTVGATVSMVIGVARLPVVLPLPTVSVNVLAATVTVPLAVELGDGVKTAVYDDPLPVNPDSEPPVALTSAAVKVVEGSESVKVMVAVCPVRSVAAELVMVTVGATVSIVIEGVRLPAVLSFPAASVNVAAATETVPSAVELGVGVNVAV